MKREVKSSNSKVINESLQMVVDYFGDELEGCQLGDSKTEEIFRCLSSLDLVGYHINSLENVIFKN